MHFRILGLFSVSLFASACGARLVVGDAPDAGAQADGAPPAATGPDGATLASEAGDARPPAWEWLNPRPDGNTIRAMHGTGPNDVWLVGAQGTIDHYDGTVVASAYRGAADETYYTVWAGAKDDVWVGGAAASGEARVLHFDGSTWTSDFALTHLTGLHAIWGFDSTHVMAHMEPAVFRWDGQTWQAMGGACPWDTNEPNCQMEVFSLEAHDLWGASWDDVWAVGNEGMIYHSDGTGWAYASQTLWPGQPTRADEVTNPFGAKNDYVGVWGSGPNDVWAAFQNDAAKTAGLSHWDGSAWTVRATIANTWPSFNSERRRPFGVGHRVWGTGPNELFAAINTDILGGEMRWDGATWSKVDEIPDTVFGTPESATFYSPAPGVMWEADEYGLHRFDASKANEPVQLNTAPYWPAVFPGNRAYFHAASAGADGTLWALGHDDDGSTKPFRWVNGWNAVDGLPDQIATDGGILLPADLGAIAVIGANDVWIAASYRAAGSPAAGDVLAHWDGAKFTLFDAPELRDLFARGPNDILGVGPHGAIVRWDGAAWSRVPWQGTEDFTGVGGTAQEAWIAGWKVNAQNSLTGQIVLHMDGSSLTKVFERPLSGFQMKVWASGPNDVWITGEPGLRWDGSTWSVLQPGGDAVTKAVWGFGPNEVWLATNFGTPAGIESVGLPNTTFRKWNGSAFTTDVGISPNVLALTGDERRVWAVGSNGTTLRRDREPVSGPPSH